MPFTYYIRYGNTVLCSTKYGTLARVPTRNWVKGLSYEDNKNDRLINDFSVNLNLVTFGFLPPPIRIPVHHIILKWQRYII